MHSSFFYVDRIDVNGIVRLNEMEVLQLCGLKTGINIFEVDNKSVARAIQAHPLVKQAVVVRHLPRQLEIKVQERQVFALIPCKDNFLAVDEEGVCIDKLTSLSGNDYRIITVDMLPEQVNFGMVVNSAAVEMVKAVWDALPEASRQEISDYHYIDSQKELLLYTNQGTEIKFGNLERLKEKTQFLEQVLGIENDYAASGADALQYVDLRFDSEPVVKTTD